MSDLQEIENRYARCEAMTNEDMDRLRRDTKIERFREITRLRVQNAKLKPREGAIA